MYELFTDRARKVVLLAHQEADRLHHNDVGSGHILLAIVKEGSGVAAHVLKNLAVGPREIGREVEELVPSGSDVGRLSLTPRARRALEHSMEETRNLGHKYVGTEHILLGLLRDEGGAAAQILTRLGLRLNEVRSKVLTFLGESHQEESGIYPGRADLHSSPSDGLPGSRAPGYERFTDRARKVMQLANQEAQRLHHEYIGTEHILRGLAGLDAGVAAIVLRKLGVEPQAITAEVDKLILTGVAADRMDDRPPTPRAKKVVEYAMRESRELNDDYVGTEHILLGLLREDEGFAAQVLMNLGLRLERVRAEIQAIPGRSNHEGDYS